MSLLNKTDLKLSYSWEAIKGDNPKISGHPDSTLFNRHEGYEVLYLINKFAENMTYKTNPVVIKSKI